MRRCVARVLGCIVHMWKPGSWNRLPGSRARQGLASKSAGAWYGNTASATSSSRFLPQPRRAASIAAMSIFRICIIASNARLAAARSGSVIALLKAIGVICHDSPHLSLHQPHALSWPPLPTIAFQ